MKYVLAAVVVLGFAALWSRRHHRPAARIRVRVGQPFELDAPPPLRPEFSGRLFHVPGEIGMAKITTTQGVEFDITGFEDRLGRKAKVDGAPVWVTDNSDVVSLEVSEDGMKCYAKATGMIGQAQVQVTVDTLIGDGQKLLIGTEGVEVTAAQATRIQLKAGDPFELDDSGNVPDDVKNPPAPADGGDKGEGGDAPPANGGGVSDTPPAGGGPDATATAAGRKNVRKGS